MSYYSRSDQEDEKNKTAEKLFMANKIKALVATIKLGMGYDSFYLEKALGYINSLIMEIEPRKMWTVTSVTRQSKIPFINETGICLSKYGDVGYGELVKLSKIC